MTATYTDPSNSSSDAVRFLVGDTDTNDQKLTDDAIDDLKELRRIADEIGAPYKVSKKDQREAIRQHRSEA